MQVRVKSLQGDEYLIEIQNDQTVSQLKASIKDKANGLPVDRQKLVYRGRTMQDTSLVSDYNLQDDCKIHLIVQRGSESASATSKVDPSKESTCSMTTTKLPEHSIQSTSSQSPTNVERGLRNNEEMIRILGEWGASRNPDNLEQGGSGGHNTAGIRSDEKADVKSSNPRKESRFEVILRERLTAHFPSRAIDRIIENLYQEIDADINSSSLDDLERLAKQKLNITNE